MNAMYIVTVDALQNEHASSSPNSMACYFLFVTILYVTVEIKYTQRTNTNTLFGI